MATEHNLYKRVSLVMHDTDPGDVYLRLEPFNHGPVTLVQVKPGDIVAISELGPGNTVIEQSEPDDYFKAGEHG